MKVMNHPNICGLKAYFYTQGDTKVNIYIIIQMLGMEGGYIQSCRMLTRMWLVSQHYFKKEGWSVPESGDGICSRDSVPRIPSLCQNQATYSHASRQIVHVPIVPFLGLLSYAGYLSSWYQATKLAGQPYHWCIETMWFWKVGKGMKGSRSVNILRHVSIVQKSWWQVNPMYPISVHDITEHPSWYLELRVIQPASIFGQQDVSWASFYWVNPCSLVKAASISW